MPDEVMRNACTYRISGNQDEKTAKTVSNVTCKTFVNINDHAFSIFVCEGVIKAYFGTLSRRNFGRL